MKKVVFYMAVCSMAWATACTGSRKADTREAVPVKTLTVSPTDARAGYDYVGTVEETIGTMLSFEVAGNIQAVYADAGKRVKKGELLAVINQASLKSMHDAAVSTLKQAKDAYARYEKLHVQGSMPEIKWVEVESKLQQAVSAEAIARKNLADSKLYAPFEGVIASRVAEQGQNVLPGEPVMKLVDIRKVNIKFSVPENEISHLAIGQHATFSVPAVGGKSAEAEISEKGVVANPLSHTYDVKMQYVNRDAALMPGMVCNVKVYADTDKAEIIIPSEAVQIDEKGGRFVWQVQHGKAVRRQVETGRLVSDDGIEINKGVSVGDKLIVEGSQKVSEGMKVTEK